MALFLVTAPSVEPVTLIETKLHLRVDHDADDALINTLILTARQTVESLTHRALITQTWDDKRDEFPCDESWWLLKPPVSSVTSVTYTATDGTSTTWSTSLYTTDLPSGPQARLGRIVPAYGQYYPTTRSVVNAATVRYVCGYGTTADTVPAPLIAAMKMLIGTWYDPARASVNVGNIVTVIPQTVDWLVWPYKAF